MEENRFIRVGSTILNLNHIVQVEIEEGKVVIYQTYQGEDYGTAVTFRGEEAEAVIRYFDKLVYVVKG